MQFFLQAGWFDLLSGYLIKSSLILALALALAFLLRKRSAGLRHLVLSLFLIGLLFLPFLSSLTSGWETGLLPTWKDRTTSPSFAGAKMESRGIPLDFQADSASESEAPLHSEGKTLTSPFSLGGFFSGSKAIFGLAALAAWFVGSVLLLSRLAMGLMGAVRLTREGRGVEDPLWKRLLNRFLAAVSLRRRVNLLSHERVRIPLTWGFLKPVVMMPAGSDGWSESQRSTALYHELAHVKRGDFLILLLARLSRALYWFNPLSWFVFRLIREEQEKACDELVLKAGIKPSTYAENLLRIRNSIPGRWNPPAPVLGALGRSQLNDRLVAILKQKLNFEEVKMKTKIMLGILVVLSISFIGLARPVSSDAGIADLFVTDGTVLQSPEPFMIAEASPLDQEKEEQEKKEKKEKKQKAEEKEEATTMVWTAKKGEEGTIQIIFDDKGEKKTIELTAPYVLTIKETPDKTIVMTSPHLELKKGEEMTWTIKSDDLHLSKDAKVIELGPDTVIHVKKHGEEGDEVIELTAKAITLDKSAHVPKDINVHVVTKDGDTKKIMVSPHVEVHPEPNARYKVVKVRPNVQVNAEAHADAHANADFVVTPQSEISKKQLEEIRESIKKLKEQDLDAADKQEELERIEKVIAQMNKQLEEQHEHNYSYTYRLHTEPLHIEMIQKGEGEEKKDVYFVGKEKNYAVAMTNDEGVFTLFIHGDNDEASREDYEKVVQRVKERLPEGYEIWTEFDEDKDRFSIKIKGGEDMDASSDVFKELMTALKEELHKVKK